MGSGSSESALPKCPYDGLPCFHPEVGCECRTFGVLGDVVVWRCRRFKSGSDRSENDKNVLDDVEKKYLKKREGKFRFGSW